MLRFAQLFALSKPEECGHEALRRIATAVILETALIAGPSVEPQFDNIMPNDGGGWM